MTTVVDLIGATVRLEQPLGDGRSTVATGFVVSETAADGTPRTVLITANHVFAGMPHDKATVGFRVQDPQGLWRYAPISVRIRDADGGPIWVRHPTQDIAAIALPPGVARAGVPVGELPGASALASLKVEPGDEMMVLGYPRGLAANDSGFPILRAGRVASYPLSPADRYPTYLVDFDVFAGNSGGPVYMALAPPANAPDARSRVVVTGLLTQQIKIDNDRLAIGNVTQADFISETLTLLGGDFTTQTAAATAGALTRPDAATNAASPEPSSMERLRTAWAALVEDFEILCRRAWIVVRDTLIGWLTPDAERRRPGQEETSLPAEAAHAGSSPAQPMKPISHWTATAMAARPTIAQAKQTAPSARVFGG
jgi:hypothetical protein